MGVGLYRQSPPLRVHFAGFESTTPRMQSTGWRFQVERYPFLRGDEITLTATHDTLGVGIFGRVQLDPLLQAVMDDRLHGHFDMQDLVVQEVVPFASKNGAYRPIILRELPWMRGASMHPEIVQITERRIRPDELFAPAAQEELIVEPETVADLFAKIKAMQQPELKRIRDENRKREQRDQRYVERVSAQIITLERAA